tara:strand:- start:47 stop:751 length:705 start_codon:yes stop_codon:yes gene_type:complete
MKIPEKELRKIVRAQILAERFDVELIPAARISACDIKIPSGYNLNSLALAAEDAMNLYGMPGSFCDMISALIPDKKGGATGSSRGSTGGTDESPPERIVLLSSVSKAIGDRNVVFIRGITSNDPQPAQVDTAMQDYSERLSELNAKEFETDTNSVVDFVVDRIFNQLGEKSDIKRKLRSAEGDDVKKIKALIAEAKVLMKAQATKEITIVRANANDADARRKLSEYQLIVDRTI